jgi:hypothetical protein
MHATEPLAPEQSAFNFEMATEKLNKHKLSGTEQISAELIKVEGRMICSEIHKLISSI